MTVREAGRRGGERRREQAKELGRDPVTGKLLAMQAAGRIGGQRNARLIALGRQVEEEERQAQE